MKKIGIRVTAFNALLVISLSALMVSSCKKKDEGKSNVPAPPVTPAQVQTPEPEPLPEIVVPETAVPAIPAKFSSPQQVVMTLAEQLQAGEMTAVEELVGKETLASPSAFGFQWLFSESGGFVVHPVKPLTDIGEIDRIQRLALNILPKDAAAGDDSKKEKVFVDVTAHPEKGFGISAIKVPQQLQELAHAAIGSDAATAAAQQGSLEEDALMKAESFLDSVLTQDYEMAVQLCDPEKVPEEKIAALCIVFEEGQYRMKDQKPLVTTAVGDESSWVIAQVESDKLNTASEFGIEMTRDEITKWKITGLNFSKMLSEYAKASDAGKVPYTPIIKNPSGGESLVLYFEYDDAVLVDRARRQIDIVSRILKSDPKKTLTITGHADAQGTDEYNASLSGNRAVAVKAALIEAGVPEEQIVTTGLGESQPLRPNLNPDGTDNPKGRGQNRRAEIFLNF